jgi:hypothetical protein
MRYFARVRLVVVVLSLAAAACGKTVPAGGVPRVEASPARVVGEAADLLPQDLDLVLRVDFSKVRASLGEEVSRELVKQAAERSGADGLARQALASAEVVWLATRLADAEAGDRVVVVHTARPKKKSDEGELVPDTISWEERSADGEGIRRFVARVPPRRDGTARIYLFGDRDAVFVSPVEAMSVERILQRGPDPRRGQPEARGLFSLDYRAGRLSPDLERRFPALAGLWHGIDRVRAIVDLASDGLALDARIVCHDPRAAEKVHRFLATIREASLASQRFGAALENLAVEQNGATVIVRWPVPTSLVVELLALSDAPDADAGEPPEGDETRAGDLP